MSGQQCAVWYANSSQAWGSSSRGDHSGLQTVWSIVFCLIASIVKHRFRQFAFFVFLFKIKKCSIVPTLVLTLFENCPQWLANGVNTV